MNEYLSVTESLVSVITRGRSLDAAWEPGTTPLAREITYGVIREYFRLGAIIDELIKKPLAEKHQDLRFLLMAGIYSIDQIRRPVYTSVNEVVESAARMNKPWAKGIVNGVLRNYLRQRDEINRKVQADPLARWNHPAWLLEQIRAAWPDNFESILIANNQHAPMTLRVNLTMTTRADYVGRLDAHGMTATPGRLTETSLYLDVPVNVTELPGFSEGVVSVQDEASQLAATLLEPVSGDRVLDACAAPGGKTCHLLELEPGIKLTSLDIDMDRSRQIRQNLKRIGAESEVVVSDLRAYIMDRPFDRVLLDAPCSATGIIRRHPDIKLLRRETDIAKLASAQVELLHAAFKGLTPNGTLLYSTCSILPAENDAVISQFLEENQDAIVDPIDKDWGIRTGNGRQLLPTAGEYDGFYFSRLKKRSRA